MPRGGRGQGEGGVGGRNAGEKGEPGGGKWAGGGRQGKAEATGGQKAGGGDGGTGRGGGRGAGGEEGGRGAENRRWLCEWGRTGVVVGRCGEHKECGKAGRGPECRSSNNKHKNIESGM